jgi:hypothetical protein
MKIFYKPNNKEHRSLAILSILPYISFFVCALSGIGRANTEVIHPSGLAYNDGWFTTSDWATDLDGNDGDTTYAYASGTHDLYFYVDMDDPSLDGYTINSLTISFVARWNAESPVILKAGFSTDGRDREIFVHDIDSRKYYQITDNELEDTYASISENYIAWMAGAGEASEIYLAAATDQDPGAEDVEPETVPWEPSTGGGGGQCFIDTAANGLGWWRIDSGSPLLH